MKRKPTHEQLLKRLGDRTAIIILAYWAKFGTMAPFDHPEFWQSKAAWEMRSMPMYQTALDLIREILKDGNVTDATDAKKTQERRTNGGGG